MKGNRKNNRPDADTLLVLYGSYTAREIGEMYGVRDTTVYRWIAKARAEVEQKQKAFAPVREVLDKEMAVSRPEGAVTFTVSKKLTHWIREHRKKCVSHATAGEQFVFEFLPSGIVECQTVKCMICKEEITDYVD